MYGDFADHTTIKPCPKLIPAERRGYRPPRPNRDGTNCGQAWPKEAIIILLDSECPRRLKKFTADFYGFANSKKISRRYAFK